MTDGAGVNWNIDVCTQNMKDIAGARAAGWSDINLFFLAINGTVLLQYNEYFWKVELLYLLHQLHTIFSLLSLIIVLLQVKLDQNSGGNKPSRVLHLRGIPSDATEGEIVQLGLPFGRMTNLVLAKKKNQVSTTTVTSSMW